MNAKQFVYQFCICVSSLACCMRADAVTLDFDELGVLPLGGYPFSTADYIEDGFRFTLVGGHYDFFARGTGNNYMNIDTQSSATFGPMSIMRLTVDGGGLFDLLNFFVVRTEDMNGSITSSAGGAASLSSAGTISFSGPAWTNLSWVDFSVGPTSPGGPFWSGWDDVNVATVPEPGTWLLLLGGLVCIALYVRQRRKFSHAPLLTECGLA